ncbi:glycosyltransferase family 4 protein [Akkermansiaceae bacterium]|nr:glycosyltransferase family 4 protein [Akkermansiaceae bacterium]
MFETKIKERKIVVVNQAVNYLTIGLCNEFAAKFESVSLVTGSIHVQGEELNRNIGVTFINKWIESHGLKKAWVYLKALLHIWLLLLTKYRKQEVFFVSVPPMGYLLNLIVPNRFSMIIWDVFPDTFKITGMQENHLVYKTWAYLNRLSFKKAYRLFTIGDRMADLISRYVEKDKILIQPIWAIFQDNNKVSKQNNPFIEEHNLQGKFIVQYSGNIGLTHKVELMLSLAEKMKESKSILFQIIGRGPRVTVLKNEVAKKGLSNCQFLPFQPDEMFPYSLGAADLGIVVLDELTAKGSVPSKAYNLMSYGIPSLYIASQDSELNNYCSNYEHAKCFTEKQLVQAVQFIENMSSDKTEYNKLVEKNLKASENFRRSNASKFVKAYMA